MSDLPVKKKRGRPPRTTPLVRPDAKEGKHAKTLWKPGQSGNPSGMAKGTRHNKTKKALAQEAIIQLFDLDKTGSDTFTQQFLTKFRELALTDPLSYAHKIVGEMYFQKDLLTEIDKQVNKQANRDLDLNLFRIRNLAFDKQAQVLDTKARNIGLMCGRRAGKTETNILKAIQVSQSQPGSRSVIIGLTILKTVDIYQPKMTQILDQLGYDYVENNELHQLTLYNGSIIQFGGNANKAEQEKYLGQSWDLIIIDEAQSQAKIVYFIESVLMPMLLDRRGTIMLTGSGPRTPGTFWEQYFNDLSADNFRANWNISSNPFIEDYQNALAEVREKNKLSETDTLYMREYLGLVAYDTEALVFKMGEGNKYTNEDFKAWLASQIPSNVRFSAGLDFGFTDANAFFVICYSKTSNLKWVVFEHKAYGEDNTDLVTAIRAGIDHILNNELYASAYYKQFNIYADSSRPDLIREFSLRHGLPVMPVNRLDKAGSIQSLRTEVRREWLRVRENSYLLDESNRTVFKRSEAEAGGLPIFITQEIDDDVYHPDAMDATIYALKEYWTDHPGTGVQEQTIDQLPKPEPKLPAGFVEVESDDQLDRPRVSRF